MTVTLNMAMSVDGKIATAYDEPANFTSRFDRARMREHRARADAVLVGAQTLRACNPPLGITDPGLLAKRLADGRTKQPAAVVITQSAQGLGEASNFWQHRGQKLVITSEAGRERLEQDGFSQKADIVSCAEAPLSMHTLVRALAERGLHRLLVEGGGELAWGFAEANLISRLHLTIAPLLLGGKTAPTPVGGNGFSMASAIALELEHLEQHGHELYLTYGRKT